MKFTHAEPEQTRFSQLEEGSLFKYGGRVHMKLCDEKNSWSGKYNSVRLQDPILQKIPDNTIVLPLEGELIFREKASLTSTLNEDSWNNDEDETEGDFLEEMEKLFSMECAPRR